MTRIRAVSSIQRPPKAVFAYVTTAAHWLEWHPSTRAVRGATDHPARLGERIEEDAVVGGRPGSVTWEVREYGPPRRWAISGVFGGASGSGEGTITYTLTPNGGGMRFERDFVYSIANPVLAALVWLVGRPRSARESRQALRNLKDRLEEGA
jgi:uncharacterized protein YndB with AHSA1/START domain